jgi:hypothetical protein
MNQFTKKKFQTNFSSILLQKEGKAIDLGQVSEASGKKIELKNPLGCRF